MFVKLSKSVLSFLDYLIRNLLLKFEKGNKVNTTMNIIPSFLMAKSQRMMVSELINYSI